MNLTETRHRVLVVADAAADPTAIETTLAAYDETDQALVVRAAGDVLWTIEDALIDFAADELIIASPTDDPFATIIAEHACLRFGLPVIDLRVPARELVHL
jgi:hypothetical protein